jgi:putative ABC transport system permease protein
MAAPAGYYFADKWLNSFAYHTSPSLLPFLTGGILAALLAFITVGSQAIKIVFRRPSVMLRSE